MEPDKSTQAKVDAKLTALGAAYGAYQATRARHVWAQITALIAFVALLLSGLGLLLFTITRPERAGDPVQAGVALVLLFCALLVAVGAFGERVAKKGDNS